MSPGQRKDQLAAFHLNAHRLQCVKDCGRRRTLVIVANGPGHREAALSDLASPSVDFMSINRPDPRIWPPRWWLLVDGDQLKQHAELLDTYPGTIFRLMPWCCIAFAARWSRHPRTVIVREYGDGFQTDLAGNGAMRSCTSVVFAMQLAVWMNYQRVYVFGCDMSRGQDGKLYPRGSNPEVSDDEREGKFHFENDDLDRAGASMSEADRRRFTFCSTYAIQKGWSFLRHFRAIPHEGNLAAIISPSCRA